MKITELFTVEAHDKGAEMEIVNPNTGKPSGVFLTLAGMDSKAYADAEKSERNAEIKRSRWEPRSAEEDDDAKIARIVACTIGWRGTDEPFSREAVENLYRNSPPVMRQAFIFIHGPENFRRD